MLPRTVPALKWTFVAIIVLLDGLFAWNRPLNASPSQEQSAQWIQPGATATPTPARSEGETSFPLAPRGQEAIASLGERQSQVARAYGLTRDQLADLFLRDHTLSVGKDGRLFYIDDLHIADLYPEEAEPQADFSPQPRAEALAIPALHSLPGADHTIFLDFDGHVTQGTSWNNYFEMEVIDSPPYSRDDNPDFNANEIADIQAIWQQVAEDFSPFLVNVTTVDPGSAALSRQGAGDTQWGVRVVLTRDTVNCNCGGIAGVGSFSASIDTPVFTFNQGKRAAAETSSHEVGHALWLAHDGSSAGSYYRGHGTGATSWGPVMGASFTPNVTHWSKGEYFDANNAGENANYGRGPDDLAVIASTANGFGYRPDDHSDNQGSATLLTISGDAVSGSGLIERTSDVDLFSFYTDEGTITLTIMPTATRTNLDIHAQLFQANGDLIDTDSPDAILSASFTLDLAAGKYFLQVQGTGTGNPLNDPPTGYTDYGSLGQYHISGTVVEDTTAPVISLLTPKDGSLVDQTVSLSGEADDSVSGIDTVSAYIRRMDDQRYWNGTDWQDDLFWLPTLLDGTTQQTGQSSLAASGYTWRVADLPAWASGATYAVGGRAEDVAGNAAMTPIHTFAVDTVVPTGEIQGAILRGGYNGAGDLNGIATDDLALASVQVSLQQTPGNLYWSGTAWTSEASWLSTTLTVTQQSAWGATSVAWSRAMTEVLWQEGAHYLLRARMVDMAGNASESDASAFVYDLTGPQVQVAVPGDLSTLTALGDVTGPVTDSLSGIESVVVYLQRAQDGLFWNGSAWQADTAWLPALLDSATPGPFGPLAAQWRHAMQGVPQSEGQRYHLRAQSVDRAGNVTLGEISSFVVDRTAPALVFATPATGVAISSTLVVSGTATDLHALAAVTLHLHRTDDDLYWNGAAWVDEETWLPTEQETLATGPLGITALRWWRSAWPALENGTAYRVRARAADGAGNTALLPGRTFTYDSAPPAVVVHFPLPNSAHSAPIHFQGTAQDAETGIQFVGLYIQRADARYWNGTDWAETLAWLDVDNPARSSTRRQSGPEAGAGRVPLAPRSPIVWQKTTGLPTWINNESYTAQVLTQDLAGNQFLTDTIPFIFDTTEPTAAITTPVNGADYPADLVFSGTAEDAGGGVAGAQIALRRSVDELYWNGTGWQADLVWLDAELAATVHQAARSGESQTSFGPSRVTWVRRDGLPTWQDDTAYQVQVQIRDLANNRFLSEPITFTVRPPIRTLFLPLVPR